MKTTSVLAAVYCDGRMEYAKRVGSYDARSFVRVLRAFAFRPGTAILLDNVAFHHSRLVHEYAREAGVTMVYVPAYSPWFNPIEGAFSIAKRHFYAYRALDAALQAVQPRHIRAFFSKAFSLCSEPWAATTN